MGEMIKFAKDLGFGSGELVPEGIDDADVCRCEGKTIEIKK